ncbi:MAG: hypothetical protein HY906_06405 [Deltaproteobacteria bacterium]|nr:hypothetical protein [Deltaproteobacteria bacterium]
MTAADRRLRSQHEYLRSDDRLREVAAVAADAAPEERLEQAWHMSRMAAASLEALPGRVRRRVGSVPRGLGPRARAVLRRLAATAAPVPAHGTRAR